MVFAGRHNLLNETSSAKNNFFPQKVKPGELNCLHSQTVSLLRSRFWDVTQRDIPKKVAKETIGQLDCWQTA